VYQGFKELQTPPLSKKQLCDRTLCAVAETLSATPTRMVEGDWQPLRELGLDDQACREVAPIIGMFNDLTRLADGFGWQLDAATQRASERGVALRRAASPVAG
jgi:hypothetical protein